MTDNRDKVRRNRWSDAPQQLLNKQLLLKNLGEVIYISIFNTGLNLKLIRL